MFDGLKHHVVFGVDLIDNTILTLNLTRSDADLNTEYKGSTALESYLSRIIYSLDDKYSITALIRVDVLLNFAIDNV